MNIEHSKTLLLPEILSKVKLNPFQENGHLLCYSSPFSNKGNLTINKDADDALDAVINKSLKP